MRATFCRCAWALGLVATATVWAQEAPAPDRFKEAVDKVKVIALGQSQAPLNKQADELDAARRVLVDKREETLAYVLPLLDENDTTVRLNGAMLLAAMARGGLNKPELVAGLTRCLNDSNPGIARWGLDGILRAWPADAPEKDLIGLNDRVAALRQCLDLSRPRALRTAAVMTLDERKPRYAIPLLVAHIQALLPEYSAQVEQKLTVEDAAPLDTGGMAAPSAPGGPGPTGPARGARSHTKRLLDPATMTEAEQTALIAKALSAPAVAELHQAGLVLEDIIRREYKEKLDFPDAHFDNQPPWNLRKCVEWVVNGWMPKHAEEFKGIPAATNVPAEAPAPKPAPAAKPAPAPAAAPAAAPAPAK